MPRRAPLVLSPPTLLVPLLLAGSMLALPAPRASGQEPGGQRPFRVEAVRVETATSVTIDADLYVPDGAGPSDPRAAVLSAHGFGGSKGSDVARHEGLARAGYVVLAPSARGFGASTGRIALNHRDHEVVDAVALIDWLAGRPEVALDAPGDPRLAIVGASYGGALGLQVARVDDRVDAVVASVTWHSLVSALTPNFGLGLAGDPLGVLKRQWNDLLFAAGGGSGLGEPGMGGAAAGDADVRGAEGPPGAAPEGSECRGFVQEICDAYIGALAAGRPTPESIEFLRAASPAEDAEAIGAPTLLVQGQRDTLFPPNEAVATAAAVARGGAEVALVWASGGHGHPMPADEQEHLERRMLAWLDRHLRGADVDTGPVFSYARPWVQGPVDERYAAQAELPAPAATGARAGSGAYALTADGGLTTDLDAAEAGALGVTVDPAQPSWSESPGLQAVEPFASRPASDPPGTFADFRTDPLDEPVTVVGIPVLEGLRFASDDEEVVVFAKLHDVAPDGSSQLLNRQVAPIRVARLSEPVDAALVGVAHRFEAGHRIRLVLAAGDAAYAPPPRPGRWSVVVDPDVARLRLPSAELAGVEPAAAVATAPAEAEQLGELGDATASGEDAAGAGRGAPLVGAALAGAAAAAALGGAALRLRRRSR